MSTICDDCMRRSELLRALAPRIAGLLDRPASQAAGLLSLPEHDLIAATTSAEARGRVERLAAEIDPVFARDRVRRARLDAVCRHSDSYPPALENLTDPPTALFVAGTLDRFDALVRQPAVAIVGARRASTYAIEVAEALGRGLSGAGVTIVSGLALGVDAAAHRGVLAGTGSGGAIAVLGGGADVPYPRRHVPLYDSLCSSGAVVSEMPPGTRPYRWSFPARNRIMAALAQVVVVVEAAEGSGSLITAEFAEDLGRDVAAVPGLVTSRMAAGANRLLRDGAHLIRSSSDVLDLLFGPGLGAEAPREPKLDPQLRSLLDAVEAGDSPFEAGRRAGLAPGEVRAALGRLEAMGLTRPDGLGGYARRAAA